MKVNPLAVPQTAVMLLEKMFSDQAEFSDEFFDLSTMTDEDKERLTVIFSASLQREVSSLLDSVNYKVHRSGHKEISRSKILFESVDIFRYVLATLNLWGMSPVDFSDAFEDRDLFLKLRRKLEVKKWEKQPVVVMDLDDVIVDFKEGFADWIESNYDITLNRHGKEYYFSKEIIEAGFTPDGLYSEFIEARKLKTLRMKPGAREAVNRLHDEGYWIHLLTSRPKDNLLCRYDTFAWLAKSGLRFHKIDFSPEKYLWLSRTDYHSGNHVVCAVDDSAKHCAEYIKHDVEAAAPRTSYNVELKSTTVRWYDTADQIYDAVKEIDSRRRSR